MTQPNTGHYKCITKSRLQLYQTFKVQCKITNTNTLLNPHRLRNSNGVWQVFISSDEAIMKLLSPLTSASIKLVLCTPN